MDCSCTFSVVLQLFSVIFHASLFMAHYLITGGCGFIGSHLAGLLLERGERVTLLDDLSTGALANIADIKEDPRLTVVIESIFNKEVLNTLIDRADIIIHLAAAVGVRLIIENPVHTIETNVKGTEMVLEGANRDKKRVILASTSEVYGKSTKLPFKEEDELVIGATNLARWGYACSKALDEFMGFAYYHEKHLPVNICRFFNTVGPRQTGQYGMVLPRFVKNALLGKPLEVHGDGTQSRCFSHVSDIVKGISSLAGRDNITGEIFNLGSREEISILELAEKVIEQTKSTSEIKMIPYEEAYTKGFEDMQRRLPDISKAEKMLGFKSEHSLTSIIDDVIAYLESSET